MGTLLDEIKAKVSAEIRATHDTEAITAAFNAGRSRVAKREGGIGLILEQLGPADGAVLLDALQGMAGTNSAIKWALVLINRGELDFGAATTRDMIDTLAAGGVMTLDQAEALKSAAQTPDAIAELAVRQVCFSDTGEWLA